MALCFPKTDLSPEILPQGLDLYLQSPRIFDHTHTIAEKSSYLFALAHRAIEIGASKLDITSIEAAISHGTAAYEIVASLAEPDKAYASSEAQMKVFYGTKRFVGDITSDADFLRKLEIAEERMAQDTPQLHEIIGDIVSPHVGYDPVSVRFALRGAATLRAMQLYIDNRLEVSAPEEV